MAVLVNLKVEYLIFLFFLFLHSSFSLRLLEILIISTLLLLFFSVSLSINFLLDITHKDSNNVIFLLRLREREIYVLNIRYQILWSACSIYTSIFHSAIITRNKFLPPPHSVFFPAQYHTIFTASVSLIFSSH